MKKNNRKLWIDAIALALVFAIGVALCFAANTPKEKAEGGGAMEYTKAVISVILTDSCEQDPVSENNYRGTQRVIVDIMSGRYKGLQMMADNTVGPLYGQPFKVGDSVIVGISTYDDDTTACYVYEFNRMPWIIVIVTVFLLVTVLVGGKVGAKSIVSLVLTVSALIWILLPLLLKGAPTILTTFAIAVLITLATFIIIGGVNRKTICACLGTLAGIALATVFGMLAQHFLRINGYRQEYAEALLQLRQTGESGIGISGLIVAGVIVSALGAVMDVAMSISSAMSEVHRVGENLTAKELFKSGLTIGRDMVGTMTNTLILAILGSGLTLIVYIYSLGLQMSQFMSSAFISLELISAVASSIGVILAVPFTALISAFAYAGANAKK